MTLLIPFAAIGKIVEKIPWQVWACAGFLVVELAFGWWCFHRGEAIIQGRWDASVQRGQILVDDLKKNQGKVTTKIVTVTQEKIKVIHEKGDTIEKLIPQYIPQGSCMLPGGFRVLHDASATNTLPGPSAGASAQPVPVEDVAKVMNFNYSLCHEERAKLDGLWKWAREQRALYLQLCKQPGVNCNKDS